MKLTGVLLLSFLVLSLQPIKAAHIVGGEIKYECIGVNTYEVTMILYRDCAGGGAEFDNPACFAMFNEDGVQVGGTINAFLGENELLDITSPDPCITIPPGLCIQKGVYVFTVVVPDADQDYIVAYQRCCRNSSIVNIETPESVGATYFVTIQSEDEFECNSSPYFNELPPTAICVGTAIAFDHSATDPDGDSLAYKFFTPFIGGYAPPGNPAPCPPEGPPFGTVTWIPGYDVEYQIDADPILTIDPVTGFLSGIPTAEGRYVVGIAVDEFRDGVLISTYYRDYQFNVQTCEPLVTAATTEFILDCEDFTVTFDNMSVGADDFEWYFGDGSSSTEFEPEHTYSDTGTYYVTLIAYPGFVCADTFIATISIYNTLTADYDYVAGCSGTPVEFTDESVTTEAGDIISWEWDFGDGSTSDEADPSYEYADGGIFTVELTVTTDKGCVSTISYEVDVNAGPDVDFTVDDVCQNEPASFDNTTTITTGTITGYLWNFGDGETSTEEDPEHFYDAPGTFDVTLIAYSANGCSDTITYSVDIGELPFADAGENDTIYYLETYELNGSGVGSFFWVPGNLIIPPGSISSLTVANPTIELTETTTFFLTVTSPDGCSETDTVTIYVIQYTIVDIPNAFSPNGDGINDEIFVLNHEVGELLEYSIFNRWGELVFTTTDLGKGWDGKVNGQEADIGTYVYLIRAVGLDEEFFQRQGNITLVK